MLKVFLYSLLCVSLMNCASTRQSRIDQKKAEFVDYPPEVQSQIQNGDIDKGFTEDMVYMSKGSPSEKNTSERSGKSITVWKYPSTKTQMIEPPRGSAPTGFAGAYGYPTPGGPAQSGTMIYGKPSLVIEFENGKVTGWKEP